MMGVVKAEQHMPFSLVRMVERKSRAVVGLMMAMFVGAVIVVGAVLLVVSVVFFFLAVWFRLLYQ